jgi:hypothetical protein
LVPIIEMHTTGLDNIVVDIPSPPASAVSEQPIVPTHHATSILLGQLYALLPLSQELTCICVLDVEKADDPDDQKIRVLEGKEGSHRLIGGSIINGLVRGKGLENLAGAELEDIVLV